MSTATASSAALGGLLLLLITVSAGLAYSISASGNPALLGGLNDFTWAGVVLSSFPRAMLTMSAAFGLWRAGLISNALFAVGVAAVVLLLLGGTTWMSDGFWAPDGVYSRLISPLICRMAPGRQPRPFNSQSHGARCMVIEDNGRRPELIKRLALRTRAREPVAGPDVAKAQVTAFRDWEQIVGERFADLESIRQPALVVNGIHDEMIPVRNSYWLSANLPNAVLLTYPDSAHGSLFQFHESFTRQATAFVASDSQCAPY